MSLINDALKKAQKLRAEESAESIPVPGSGGRVAKRKPAQSSNTVILLGAGALVLVVVSVVATVWLVNRPSTPRQPAIAKAATPPPATSTSPASTSPVISAPPIVAPSVTPAPSAPPAEKKPAEPIVEKKASPSAPVPTVAIATPPPVATTTPPPASQPTPAPAQTTPVTSATTTPAATTTTPAATTTVATKPAEQPVTPAPAPTQAPAPASPPAVPRADDRISAFVDAIRVAGIRSSGTDSRVLMNDRVYRVNDIVERTLGVRLIKVATDSLTFSDANGITYVKNF